MRLVAQSERMDRGLLAEYGWDVEVPPYTAPVTEGERRREVVDRLFRAVRMRLVTQGEGMDRGVLAEYGWDVEVPPYTAPVTEGERRRLETFEGEVIDAEAANGQTGEYP